MSSSPALEQSSPSATTPSSPAIRPSETGLVFQTSTPNFQGKKLQQPPLFVSLPAAPNTSGCQGEQTLTPPPRSPGIVGASPSGTTASGDARSSHQPPDGTSSDKSSEAAAGSVSRTPSTALSRKESYKAQRQHYRREKKRAAATLLHNIEDPSVVVLADWLKVRGSLKSWTKLWCVLKPGLLLLYKSPKAKSSHWVGTVLLTSCQVIERPSKKDGFCFKLYHPLEQSIWAPRGPHHETIGAVVQPLPTSHVIFRAPSPAAGHCWLDGLELALRGHNAMLRCSRSRPEESVVVDSPDAASANLSHDELEKHFNETEMASAASDSESDDGIKGSQELVPKRRQDVVAKLRAIYVEDMNLDVGTAGELVEEVAEENKSLLWFLLKQVRPGMDLSKVVLPTFILEARSFLDKLSDYYYHADLLAEASKQDDPFKRFKGVLQWYLSGMYRKPKGLKKPYNPVLGEAFRCCWRRPHEGNGEATYYVAEQVSHHPPVSAFYVSNRKDGYTIEGSLLARSKFYGNSTSAILEGCARVRLLDRNEVYISTAPYAHCKGLLIGTLSMELGGKVTIMCQQTGYTADVEFKLRSFLGGADQTNQLTGKIRRGKDTVATIEGYWDHRIDIKDKRTGEECCLLDVATLKERRLPRYLINMDQQMEYESAKLWRHVSEAIHNDDQVAATEQKTIIEERQRAKAKLQETEWRPMYFLKDNDAKAPEGIIDQGYRYKYSNHSPWMNEEVLEYEEDFVIKSLHSGASSHTGRRPAELNPALPSDSESGPQDNARRKHANTTRSLKNTLSSIDSALKEQSVALERLSQKVDSLSVSQKSSGVMAEQGRVPAVSFFWDLLCGVILAMICQALFNWMFYYKD